jgi:hypothetical protein
MGGVCRPVSDTPSLDLYIPMIYSLQAYTDLLLSLLSVGNIYIYIYIYTFWSPLFNSSIGRLLSISIGRKIPIGIVGSNHQFLKKLLKFWNIFHWRKKYTSNFQGNEEKVLVLSNDYALMIKQERIVMMCSTNINKSCTSSG